MDTKIVKKKNKLRYVIIGTIIVLIAFLIYKSLTTKRSLSVTRSSIAIKSVEKTSFEDFISFQAKVAPLNEMLINVVEGGSVQQIFVENGDIVKKGQELLKLANPNTELNYMQQETAIVEQINNLNKAKLDLRNQELNMAKDLISIQHDYTNAKNLYELNKKLFEKEIIANNEWVKTKESYRYQKERVDIIKESIQKEKQANKLQIGQINQAIFSMQKSLNILRLNKQNFLVKAPLSGRLTSFNPILGKNYTQGESIGKIDVMSGYKLIAEVDEFYLNRISKNQTGTINFNSELIAVTISKVMPEINEGRFIVELNFNSDKKLELKQGSTYGVRLNLSNKKEALVIPKGSFYTDTSGEWIFVVKNNKAERRTIKLGKENPMYYEVLEGLEINEQVITSSYKNYEKIEEINIIGD